jgi:hypothetical protein
MSILITDPDAIDRLRGALGWVHSEWKRHGNGDVNRVWAGDWEQYSWDACLASEIVVDAGWSLVGDGGTAKFYDPATLAGREQDIESTAWELLGIPVVPELEDEFRNGVPPAEADLFGSSNSIFALFTIAAAYTDGEITIPADIVGPADLVDSELPG